MADLLSSELSSHTLAALQEFLQQQQQQQQSAVVEDSEDALFSEDWGMSQFWYDEETAATLAKEVVKESKGLPIACVACPSLFRELKKAFPSAPKHLLEFDRRFERFGTEFSFYDYNSPTDLPPELAGRFSVVVADPPYLSEECLAKMAETMNFLASDPVHGRMILLSGAVQRERSWRILKARPCKFRPTFKNKLANEFCIFTNYRPSHECLGGWEEEDEDREGETAKDGAQEQS